MPSSSGFQASAPLRGCPTPDVRWFNACKVGPAPEVRWFEPNARYRGADACKDCPMPEIGGSDAYYEVSAAILEEQPRTGGINRKGGCGRSADRTRRRAPHLSAAPAHMRGNRTSALWLPLCPNPPARARRRNCRRPRARDGRPPRPLLPPRLGHDRSR